MNAGLPQEQQDERMTDRNARHQQSMQKLKTHVDGRVAAATEQRGLLMIFTLSLIHI